MNPFFKWAGIGLTALGALGLSLVLAGCAGGFHPLQDAPTWSDPASSSYDPSTPKSYLASTKGGWDSGILDEITRDGVNVFVITTNRAHTEPKAVPYIDKYGNLVFSLDVSIITAEYKAKEDATVKRLEGAK